MTWVRKMFGKIIDIHATVIHDISICYGFTVGGSDTLGGNRDTKYFFALIVVLGNEILDRVSDLFVIDWCIFVCK